MHSGTLSAGPGVATALAHMNDSRAYYLLGGDMGQLGIMYTRLLQAGFHVLKCNVYPGFPQSREDEYRRALAYIYESRVEGWWNQERDLITYAVCTQAEFDAALGRSARVMA